MRHVKDLLSFCCSIGVTFCLVDLGVDEATFEAGLTEWRRRHAHREAEADSLKEANDELQGQEEEEE